MDRPLRHADVYCKECWPGLVATACALMAERLHPSPLRHALMLNVEKYGERRFQLWVPNIQGQVDRRALPRWRGLRG